MHEDPSGTVKVRDRVVMADRGWPMGGEDSMGGNEGAVVGSSDKISVSATCDEVVGEYPPGNSCGEEASGTCEVWDNLEGQFT